MGAPGANHVLVSHSPQGFQAGWVQSVTVITPSQQYYPHSIRVASPADDRAAVLGRDPCYLTRNAIVDISVSAGCVESTRVCWTTIGTLLSTTRAKGFPGGTDSPLALRSELIRM